VIGRCQKFCLIIRLSLQILGSLLVNPRLFQSQQIFRTNRPRRLIVVMSDGRHVSHYSLRAGLALQSSARCSSVAVQEGGVARQTKRHVCGPKVGDAQPTDKATLERRYFLATAQKAAEKRDKQAYDRERNGSRKVQHGRIVAMYFLDVIVRFRVVQSGNKWKMHD